MPPQTEESRWFSEHVAQHGPELRAYLARRFPSLHDQDDLVQETYLRAVRLWKLGRMTHVRGFLFTAARRIAIDRLRGQTGREHVTDEKALRLLDEAPSVPDEIDHRQRQGVLVDAIAALPPQCRRVMVGRYVHGLSYQEIALQLGLSPQTVKAHLVKGVRDCIEYFDTRGMLEAFGAPKGTA